MSAKPCLAHGMPAYRCKPCSRHALAVAKELATRMRAYYRDTTYGGIPRTYAMLPGPGEDWIEYIPPNGDIRYHGKCEIGCDDSTHREF